MGRPRQTKLDPIKFLAHRDNESKQFDSRRAANEYVGSARRSSRVDPIYWKCRYWVLHVEHVPLPGEEHLDHEDYSGHQLSEREAVLKGSDSDALLAKAEGLRRASFDREWPLFNSKSNLNQLSPDSRLLALSSIERFYERTDERYDREQAERVRKQAEAETKAKEAAIPTVAAMFDAEVGRRLKAGLIQQNTADTYRYEATAFIVGDADDPMRKKGAIETSRRCTT